MSTTSEPTVKTVGEDRTEQEFRSTKQILTGQLVDLAYKQEYLAKAIKEAKAQQERIKVEIRLTEAALAVATGATSLEAEVVQEPLVTTVPKKRTSRKTPPGEIPRYKQRRSLSQEEIDERDLLQEAIIEFAKGGPNPGEVTMPEVVGYLAMKGLGDYSKKAPGNKEFKLRWSFYELADTGVLEKTNEKVFASATRENLNKSRKADLYRLVPRSAPRESETKEADLAST